MTLEDACEEAGVAITILAERKRCLFRRNGRALPPPLALMSSDLTAALMKSAVFALNLHGLRDDWPGLADAGRRGRFVLCAIGFDYAIDAAPDASTGSGTGSGDRIIDCEALFDQVRAIEQVFGHVPVDPALVSSVMSAARRRMAGRLPGIGAPGVAS